MGFLRDYGGMRNNLLPSIHIRKIMWLVIQCNTSRYEWVLMNVCEQDLVVNICKDKVLFAIAHILHHTSAALLHKI